jgi:hypothetical protein
MKLRFGLRALAKARLNIYSCMGGRLMRYITSEREFASYKGRQKKTLSHFKHMVKVYHVLLCNDDPPEKSTRSK